jgi:phage shock protein PspC (stress-responsive transcriptional regulator)
MTAVTTERSEHAATPRSLRRRSADRVLGGVAGGLGDYFNIDPLLVRIAFVGLMIFGGAGLVLYVIGWLLIPAEGHDASPVESLLRGLGLTARRLVWIALGLAVGFLVIVAASRGDGYVYFWPLGFSIDTFTLLAIGIVVTGIVVLRGRAAANAQPSVVASAPVVKAPPRPRSPLALYAYAAVLLSIGLLALASQVADVSVAPGQFFGAALTVLGVFLVIGAWWGRARILILVAILLIPVAILSSFITTPLEGGIGDHRYTPVTAAEVRDEYRSMGGRMILDLQDLQTSPRTIHIAASVAVGQLVVILPEGASFELRTRVGAGDSYVLGSQDVGTSLESRYVRHHLNQTTYLLDLEMGIGEVFVTDSRVNW